MILVTLGTQKQPFLRLLNYIENSNIEEKIIVQAGHTIFSSEKMELFSFKDYKEMGNLIKKASIIITHGGTGSIIEPLKLNKKVIVCARKKKYGEHIDDHQEEIVELFVKEGFVLELNELNDINEVINRIKKFKPKTYNSDTSKFKLKLINEIDLLLKDFK